MANASCFPKVFFSHKPHPNDECGNKQTTSTTKWNLFFNFTGYQQEILETIAVRRSASVIHSIGKERIE